MASILFKIVKFATPNSNATIWKTGKPFLNFLFHFSNLHQILNILKEKMIVIINVFPKLDTVNNFLRTLSKRLRFRTRFDSQYVKASQIVAKSPWERFYHIFSSFSWKLIWKMSPLLLGEILGLFVNTLTADAKCPVQDCENLQLSIQIQLSEKRKKFFNFLFHFWNLNQILNIWKEKIILIANVIRKLQTLKNFLRTLSQKRLFRTRIDSQHVKPFQRREKSPWDCF